MPGDPINIEAECENISLWEVLIKITWMSKFSLTTALPYDLTHNPVLVSPSSQLRSIIATVSLFFFQGG